MDLGLKDKVAMVSGGSRGIGRAICGALAEEGCKLAISARGEERLSEAVRELEAYGVKALGVRADMAAEGGPERFFEGTLRAFGTADILVNNVGGSRPGGLEETSDEDWRAAFSLNLFHAVTLSRLAVPEMKRKRWGRILNVASIYGREWGGYMTYNASKAALISFTKALARELAPFNVLVNSIAPGSILFPGGSWERRMNAAPDRLAGFIHSELPSGRFGRPEEVAALAAFMVSERASLLTGACVNVDGGQGRSNI
ncbi:MAG: SDR family NAD(P)-dependent oxidoreductase [Nitrospinota bacterium]